MRKHPWLPLFLTTTLIVLGWPNSTSIFDRLLNVLLVVIVAIEVIILPRFITIQNKKLIIPLLLIFVSTTYINSSRIRNYLAREPVAYSYRTDMDDFLKTFFLMKHGNNYYASFKMAIEQNPFKGKVSDNLWSWRLPTVFYVWNLLPGDTGISIYMTFVSLTLLTLYASFEIAEDILGEKLQHLAILSPYLLYGYFHFGVRDETLLQTEWWGLFAVIFGIYFVIKRRPFLASLFFTFAVLVRELYCVPFFITAILSGFKKRQFPWVYLFPVGAFFLAIGVHSYFVRQELPASTQFFNPRLHQLSRDIIRATFAFGSWEYMFYRIRLFIILYILGFISIVKRLSEKTLLLLSFFIFPFSFWFIGTSVYNDYWGIMYIPIVLLTAPFIVQAAII